MAYRISREQFLGDSTADTSNLALIGNSDRHVPLS
jgi:hypothetical protein